MIIAASAGALGAVLSVCMAQPSTMKRLQLGDVASLEIPDDANIVAANTLGRDFKLYDVVRNGEILLGVYLGNAAAFPSERYEVGKIESCIALSTTRVTGRGLSRDVLIGFENVQIFPQHLHMFYENVTRGVADQLDLIIASARILNGHQCITELPK